LAQTVLEIIILKWAFKLAQLRVQRRYAFSLALVVLSP